MDMNIYRMIHKDLNCPICRKPLIEHRRTFEVVCSDVNCRFNKDIMTELLDINKILSKEKKL